MTIEKVDSVVEIRIAKEGTVHIITEVSIVENGSVITKNKLGKSVAPGADYSGEDARVQAICAATHTADVIAAYQAAIQENRHAEATPEV